jgi:C-terminal processing protease CtpA/Prc
MKGAIAIVCASLACGTTGEFTRVDRERAEHMLRDVAADVREHYYDPALHGVDLDARVAAAQQQIEQSDSMARAILQISGVLDSLNDSHTFFLSPLRPYRHEYGWRWLMVGDRCLVTSVQPGSDAEAKGLVPGDEILAVNGYRLSREGLWKIEYVYKSLQPQRSLRLRVRSPSGVEREIDVSARVERIVGSGRGGAIDRWDVIRERENRAWRLRARVVRSGDAVAIMKLPVFDFSDDDIAEMIDRIRGVRGLILDLRGNPGGRTQTLQAVAGFLFGREVKLADRVFRERTDAMMASRSERPFDGKLVVLVDSASASSSEVLARVVQLERRGIVIGDRTAGRVREAAHYTHHVGVRYAIFFGTSVSEADLVMSDGRNLENNGVMPDVIALPTAEDIALGLDPVLARAVASLGGSITAQDAGRLFPIEWND